MLAGTSGFREEAYGISPIVQQYQFDNATLRFNAAYTYRIPLIAGDKSFSFFRLQIPQPSCLIESPKRSLIQKSKNARALNMEANQVLTIKSLTSHVLVSFDCFLVLCPWESDNDSCTNVLLSRWLGE